MSFKEHLDGKRRLAILHLLSENAGEANDSVLQTVLANQLGFPLTSREEVRKDLTFLEQHALIRTEMFGPVMVAKLLERGLDYAEGRGPRIDGLSPPRPIAR
jgi:hypothetical protein